MIITGRKQSDQLKCDTGGKQHSRRKHSAPGAHMFLLIIHLPLKKSNELKFQKTKQNKTKKAAGPVSSADCNYPSSNYNDAATVDGEMTKNKNGEEDETCNKKQLVCHGTKKEETLADLLSTQLFFASMFLFHVVVTRLLFFSRCCFRFKHLPRST